MQKVKQALWTVLPVPRVHEHTWSPDDFQDMEAEDRQQQDDCQFVDDSDSEDLLQEEQEEEVSDIMHFVFGDSDNEV